MTGETDLAVLLRSMQPDLRGKDWGFAVAHAVPEGILPFATVAEDEGLTLVAPMAALQSAGLAPEGPMARISLTVHSSLQAVGLTAAFATALGQAGISANVIAGFHHDHIFVAAADADRAMTVLRALSNA
ncbi:ACT domain-containing protein [Aliigemmobacter aestuarii]|uniref:ACT domain-containing protein n=1 Tax=Aliigemmobacter aestuarii TaxID=1445661 RepID=A0A4S3MS98_9RHOB|nr:ACT domain-containing protein [Gemmobacter aestuarii]THD85004.1 ACT domain-containing protein [Gemmobacter aestuarii]